MNHQPRLVPVFFPFPGFPSVFLGSRDYAPGRPSLFASFGKIRFKTAFEQGLWLECSRLIANCIIFYNASILSRLLEHQERIGDMQAADATKKVSPIAWQHINLHGRYEFLKQLDPINVGAIIRELTKIPMNHETSLAA